MRPSILSNKRPHTLKSQSHLTLRYHLLSPHFPNNHRLLRHPFIPRQHPRARQDRRARRGQAAQRVMTHLQVISEQGLQVRELCAFQHIPRQLRQKVALLFWDNRSPNLIPVDELRGFHLPAHEGQGRRLHRRVVDREDRFDRLCLTQSPHPPDTLPKGVQAKFNLEKDDTRELNKVQPGGHQTRIADQHVHCVRPFGDPVFPLARVHVAAQDLHPQAVRLKGHLHAVLVG